jgi:hypothetical protein
MSEGLTLQRRWFPFDLIVPSVVVVALLTVSTHALADDTTAVLPDSLKTQISRVLPDSWKQDVKGSRLVLRPRKLPTFVNLVNAEGRTPAETIDDYHRRHTVKVDYQIVLRFEPKLSPEEVRRRVSENREIRDSLQVLEKSPLAILGKGDVSFPETPEGTALSQQREQLLKSFRSVPAGSLGNLSVYVEPTNLGYATFLHEEEEQEADAVEKLIRDELTPYTGDPIKAASNRNE